LVVKILQHLREIERRRLYADLGYSSLFDYTVRELGFSEGQANRRITAMRMMKDLPEMEAKIAAGTLTLSNVQQAQTLIREMEKASPESKLCKEQKLAILAKVECKSVREAQKELVSISPSLAMPRERERVVTEDITEVRFLMTESLKAKLEELRSLLGSDGATMSYAELFDTMTDLSIAAVKAKKFGKKRSTEVPPDPEIDTDVASPSTSKAPKAPVSENPRYVPKAIKHEVWKRDRGCCTNCGSRKHLNYDHIQPVALGGLSSVDNLRLLCFGCNQRASVNIFGPR
jgi:hypothetical protein